MSLATTYGLNNSHTKMIHVGLQKNKRKNLQTSCKIERTQRGRNLFRHRLLATVSRSHEIHVFK